MSAVKRCKVRLAVKTVEDIPQNEVASQLMIAGRSAKGAQYDSQGQARSAAPLVEEFRIK